jgi:hypothetical protein
MLRSRRGRLKTTFTVRCHILAHGPRPASPTVAPRPIGFAYRMIAPFACAAARLANPSCRFATRSSPATQDAASALSEPGSTLDIPSVKMSPGAPDLPPGSNRAVAKPSGLGSWDALRGTLYVEAMYGDQRGFPAA